jgi:hypothetical protein
MDGNKVARILRRIADAVDGMSEAALAEFIFGLREVRPRRRGPSSTKLSGAGRESREKLETVVAQLQRLSTREEGLLLLDQLNWTREELAGLARRMDVHVIKDDNIGRIKDKLVETAIGSR